jgi:hypothetical protein
MAYSLVLQSGAAVAISCQPSSRLLKGVLELFI